MQYIINIQTSHNPLRFNVIVPHLLKIMESEHYIIIELDIS